MSLFFYGSLLFLRVTGLYMVLSMLASIFMDIVKIDKNRLPRKFVLGKKLSFIFLILLFFSARIRMDFFQGYTNWNPKFAKEDVVGTWKKGNREIILEENGSVRTNFNYHILANSQNNEYLWSLSFSIPGIKVVNSAGNPVAVFRLILFCNEFRLLEEFDNELMLANLGYAKISE